jgi:pimeloyl-ACP methyl ester carboxylesterase
MSKVLIHGGGYGKDCWEPLLPFLRGNILAVDLPGRGARADVALPDVTLTMCAEAVRDDVISRQMTNVVLVGHSLAGVTVPRVIEMLASRVTHVVLVSGVVPPHGTTVLDGIDADVRVAVKDAIAGGVYAQTRDAGRAMLCNDLTDEQCEWALDRVVDDAAALLNEPVDLAGYKLGVPVTYVRLDADQTYPPELQEQAQRITAATPVHINAGHMAMISQPEKLAAVINAVD